MRRSTLPFVLAGALALGACQEEVAEETTPATDSVEVSMQAAAPAEGEMMDGALMNPETASEADLMGLGLDSATVAAIVAARPLDDMLEVDAILVEAGMDEAARDEVYARMFKPLDLNSATPEEILLVPGLGDRMVREFEEYRPYTDIAQFQREMGKYVDDEEVARMTKYVTIREGGM